jgi:hypothetical protein
MLIEIYLPEKVQKKNMSPCPKVSLSYQRIIGVDSLFVFNAGESLLELALKNSADVAFMLMSEFNMRLDNVQATVGQYEYCML